MNADQLMKRKTMDKGTSNSIFIVIFRPRSNGDKQWNIATTGANRAEAITTDYKRARAIRRGIKTQYNKRYKNGVEVKILRSYISLTKETA